MPDSEGANAAGAASKSEGKVMSIQKNDANRSHKTGRLFPTPNKPDPMPAELAFLYYIILYYIILHYIILHYIMCYYIISYDSSMLCYYT